MDSIGQMIGMIMYVLMIIAMLPLLFNILSGLTSTLRFTITPIIVTYLGDGKWRVEYRYCSDRKAYVAYTNYGRYNVIVQRSDGSIELRPQIQAIMHDGRCVEGSDIVVCEEWANDREHYTGCKWSVEVGDCLDEGCDKRKAREVRQPWPSY